MVEEEEGSHFKLSFNCMSYFRADFTHNEDLIRLIHLFFNQQHASKPMSDVNVKLVPSGSNATLKRSSYPRAIGDEKRRVTLFSGLFLQAGLPMTSLPKMEKEECGKMEWTAHN